MGYINIMITNTTKTRTGKIRYAASYVATFNPNSPSDTTEIQNLRRAVHLASAGKKYLKLQGRLGPNNPNRDKYLVNGKWPRWCTCVKLADAGYVDAYVYERSDFEYENYKRGHLAYSEAR